MSETEEQPNALQAYGNGDVTNENSLTKMEKDEKSEQINFETDPENQCHLNVCHSRCGNVLAFSLVYGFSVLVTSALGLYVSSQITTIEKHFGLSSTQSGIILSSNDVGFLITVLIISHYGTSFHIPRVLSISILVYGISGLLATLPQLISSVGMPNVGESGTNSSENRYLGLCKNDNSKFADPKCEGKENHASTGMTWVVAIFVISMFVQGVGKSPRSSLGTLYIDNASNKKKTGLYLGIVSTLGMFGPFVGILLGGVFGKIPVDLNDTQMTPEDPRWIGAWWIGFLLFGILGIVTSFPVFLFPKSLNNVSPSKQVETDAKEAKTKSRFEVIKDLPKAMLRIVRCPVYVLTLIGLLILMFGVIGGSSFGPKYLENQFNLPTWKSNVYLGIGKLITASSGTFIGGCLTSKFRMNRRKCLKMITILSIISTILSSLEFLFGCGNTPIHGYDEKITLDKDSCGCVDVPYRGVCGSDGKTYFSPCHARCQNVTNNIYGGCAALGGDMTAKPGICDTGCKFLIPYLVVSISATLVGTMTVLPVYMVFLRSVPEGDRALGMGFLSFIMSLVVFFPSPLFFGKVFDNTCRIWSTSCGVKGSCAVYDIEHMRYSIIGIGTATRALSLVFMIISFVIASRNDKDKKDDEINMKDFKLT